MLDRRTEMMLNVANTLTVEDLDELRVSTGTAVVEELPTDLRVLLSQIRRRDFAVNLRHDGLDRLSTTIDRASRTIAYGFVVAAVIVGSAIMILAERGDDSFGVLSILGFGGILVTWVMIVSMALWNFYKLRFRRK